MGVRALQLPRHVVQPSAVCYLFRHGVLAPVCAVCRGIALSGANRFFFGRVLVAPLVAVSGPAGAVGGSIVRVRRSALRAVPPIALGPAGGMDRSCTALSRKGLDQLAHSTI